MAREGLEGTSYNQIIAETGISRTTAYLYLDGKQDLIAEVRRNVYARLNEVMGVASGGHIKTVLGSARGDD